VELANEGAGVLDRGIHRREDLGGRVVLADQGRVGEADGSGGHGCSFVAVGWMTTVPARAPAGISGKPLWSSAGGMPRSIPGRTPFASSSRSIATSSLRVQPVEPRIR